jgi:hypothetical protein
MVREMQRSIGRKGFDQKEFRALLRSEAANSRTMALLATKMRLTQQSTIDARIIKPAKKRPWD